MTVRAAVLGMLFGAWALACWPAPAAAQPSIQVITSFIGDFDCFGHGAPVGGPVRNPCGTLPGYPLSEADDAAGTDTWLQCPSPSAIGFNHRFVVPAGGTILGAVWQMNVGGIEVSKYPGKVILNGALQLALPDTGPLGTTLVAVPLVGALTDLLAGGILNVQLVRGMPGTGACDDVFVDYAALAILVGF